ncbi:MAG: MBL fold metallo-hydrolase [Phycisphaerales bacterium]|nr:MBL fold metallo-hydrolase [Phycisphaerales bacterium]
MLFRQIADDRLAQYAYLVGCQKTKEAILFDPERDIDRYLAIAEREGVRIVAVAETHIHADFLSGAREFAERTGAHVYVSAEGGSQWQSTWASPYKHTLLHDGTSLSVGGIECRAMHTPGHTPEHMCFLVTDRGAGATIPIGIISGDFVFVGDLGRPDLLKTAAGETGSAEPSARALLASARTFCQLPDALQVWPGHGAGSVCGKSLGAIPQSTVGYEKATSPILQLIGDQRAFVDDILSGQPEPPMYFARMKCLNRDGVPLLGEVPQPPIISDIAGNASAWERPGTIVIDTRPWAAFRDGHLPGSLHAPASRMFSMVVGSYLSPDDRIVLVCDPQRSDGFIREMVRIGLDKVIAVVPDGAIAASSRTERTAEVSVGEAANQSGRSFILDVRGADEVARGCIAGSINIAYTRLSAHLSRLPRDRRILVHCALGGRSAAATAMLCRLGFDAANVAGGFEEWKRQGLPVQSMTANTCAT